VIATAGLVFVSFGGLTKVTSIAEEIKNPGVNIPLGMILAWLVVTCFYIAVVAVVVGVVDGEELVASYAPVALAASKFTGTAGFLVLSVGAMTAFVTTANGGILAASRSPLAMSRDSFLPAALSRVSKRFGTPHYSILLTSLFMIEAIVFLDIESLVKTASTLMLILFILDNASVIIMRESKIQSYRPMFRSPLYPFPQLFAVVTYLFLIIDMGALPLSITGVFIIISVAWYYLYASKKVRRASAAMHIVERVTDRQLQSVTLENELRDILLERDQITEDRFDRLIKDCEILDIPGRVPAEHVFRKVAKLMETRLDTNEYVLFEKLLAREAEGGTVVQPGFAIPHVVVDGENKFDVLLVRALDGVDFAGAPDPVKIMFFLAGSKDQRNYHLRALMAIAQVAQEKHFEKRWLAARGTEEIRNLILLSTRKRDQT
jgi:mannitol/fructose-specific phosphotransferase system IIA component (Ntr-type)